MSKHSTVINKSLFVALLSTMAGGCASMHSMPGPSDGKAVTGIPYFLPKQMVRISGTRPQTTVEEAFTSLGGAQADHDLLKSKAKAAVARRDTAKVMLEAGIESGAALATLQAEFGKLEGEARLLQQQLAAAATALEDAKKGKDEALSGGSPDGECVYKVSISLLEPVADHSQTYYLKPQHHFLRDDEVKLALTKDGLLTNAEAISVGRAADVVVEFATSVGALLGIKTRATGTNPFELPAACTALPDEFNIDFDPVNAVSLDNANTSLKAYGFLVNVTNIHGSQTSSNSGKGSNLGIIYRSPGSMDIVIKDFDKVPLLSTTVSLPQAGKLALLPMAASPFVKTTSTMKFENGMLVAVDSNRPSEAMEVARLPGRAVGALFTGATNMLAALGGTIAGKTELSTAELEAFTAQQKLLAVTECVDDAKRAGEPTLACFD